MTRTHLLAAGLAAAALAGACSDTKSERTATETLMQGPATPGVADMTTQSANREEGQGAATTVDALARQITVDTSVRMIIRTGSAHIRVDDVSRAVAAVRQLAAQMGGYIANTSFQGGREHVRSATLEIKLPAPRYDAAVVELSKIGEVESVHTNAEDVGEEYVDLSARIANARRLEQRLVELLANRTGRLQDVLAVERELARVRSEIERIEGRMRYLRTRVALSTLTVTVHEGEPLHGRAPGDDPITAAFKKAWRNFVALIVGVIAAMGVLVPLAAVAAAGWFAYRRLRRR